MSLSIGDRIPADIRLTEVSYMSQLVLMDRQVEYRHKTPKATVPKWLTF